MDKQTEEFVNQMWENGVSEERINEFKKRYDNTLLGEIYILGLAVENLKKAVKDYFLFWRRK